SPPPPVALELLCVSHGCWAVFSTNDAWLTKLRDTYLCRELVSDGCIKLLQGPYFPPRRAG
ncbi:MAG TPA: hypothetical protein VN914_07780, partial [Polyangia bacterium]|nr:hypothetical protein [Polyangia bacterium]